MVDLRLADLYHAAVGEGLHWVVDEDEQHQLDEQLLLVYGADGKDVEEEHVEGVHADGHVEDEGELLEFQIEVKVLKSVEKVGTLEEGNKNAPEDHWV